MDIYIIGLGKMGYGFFQFLNDDFDNVFGFDIDDKKMDAIPSPKRIDGIEKIWNNNRPKIILYSLPSGEVTNSALLEASERGSPGDIIIDAGNSYYQDTLYWNDVFLDKKMDFVDAGVSGGIRGSKDGYCLMVGSDDNLRSKIRPIFESLSQDSGLQFVGPVGSGHYLKMVHNAIEYGMMQAIAEGFNLLKNGRFDYDLRNVAELFNQGSIISGFLMETMIDVFENKKVMEEISSEIDSSGEAYWYMLEVLEEKLVSPVIANALFIRYASKSSKDLEKMVAMMRKHFGGHRVYFED